MQNQNDLKLRYLFIIMRIIKLYLFIFHSMMLLVSYISFILKRNIDVHNHAYYDIANSDTKQHDVLFDQSSYKKMIIALGFEK